MVRPSYKKKKTYPTQRPKYSPMRSMSYTRNRFVTRTLGTPTAYGESKYYEVDYQPTPIPLIGSTWSVTNAVVLPNLGFRVIAAPTRGTESFDREGRKIKLCSVRINGLINQVPQVSQTAGDNSTHFRLILVLDTQCNGTQALGADVIASSNASTNNTSQIYSFQNISTFGRFKILKDKRYSITSVPIAGIGTSLIQGGSLKQFKINHVFSKPLVINFNAGNTGGVGDVVDNNVFLMCGATNVEAAPSLQFRCRIMFKE